MSSIDDKLNEVLYMRTEVIESSAISSEFLGCGGSVILSSKPGLK